MDNTRLDSISRFFSERKLSRRRAVQQGAAGLAAAGVTATGVTGARAAQEGTPDPLIPEMTSSMLFVQSFQSGSIAAKDGEEGAYTLTLDHGIGQTVYFTDRPERLVGATPTAQFLAGFNFNPENPPNAALVIGTDDGNTDIAVIELTNPVYDETSNTASYDVSVLENFSDSGHAFQVDPVDLAEIAASFGTAHLLIDDCPNDRIDCKKPVVTSGQQWKLVNSFLEQGFCSNYGLCIPCVPFGHNQPYRSAVVEYWTDVCNGTYGDCEGACIADFQNRCTLTFEC